MVFRILLGIILLTVVAKSNAQFTIKGSVYLKKNCYVYLYEIEKSTQYGVLIDSILIDSSHKFQYTFKGRYAEQNLYRLSFLHLPKNNFDFPNKSFVFSNSGKKLHVLIQGELTNIVLKQSSPENRFLFNLQKQTFPYFSYLNSFQKSNDESEKKS